MRFLHASIHGQQFTDAVASSSAGRSAAPLPLIVACPKCHDWYFSELGPGAQPWKFERASWEAQEILAGECPDHAHWFDIAGD